MNALISLNDVCKSFGGIVVADHISIDIHRGEILGLIGPNGAGKTSLFNLISGVYPVDAGTISVAGQSLDGLALHRRARLGVARTWQNMRLFATMSVLENMLVAPRDYPGEKISHIIFRPKQVAAASQLLRERAMVILGRMKLEAIAHANVNDITFGHQKLVGLARALHLEVVAAGEEGGPVAGGLRGAGDVALRQRLPDVAVARAGQGDQAVGAFPEPLAAQLGVAAVLVLPVAARKPVGEPQVARARLREQQNAIGLVALGVVRDPDVAAEDRLQPPLPRGAVVKHVMKAFRPIFTAACAQASSTLPRPIPSAAS